ncbi:hypothetical protein HRbin36_01005 [bacterium HR36]|nr:hypothetical protein HRbin36_01005 [bacterium HR36]
MHAERHGAIFNTAATHHEVLIYRFRGKRDDRSQQLAQRKQDFVKRLIGSEFVLAGFAFPEPAPIPPHVPVAELFIHKFFHLQTHSHGVITGQFPPGYLNE